MKNAWFYGLLVLVLVIVGVLFFSNNANSPLLNDGAVVDIPITENDFVYGNPDASVTLVEFSDFQCPACRQFSIVTKQALDEFPEDLKLVYKNFPLNSIHKNADISARAAVASGAQNKFWEMHDLLFLNQSDWSSKSNPEDDFVAMAESLELDIEKFREDLNSEETKNKVTEDLKLANSLGLNSTPSFFLNGKIYSNFKTIAEFMAGIEAEIENSKQ